MTKDPAESLDNLDGQVSLETPVCLEIKEKEVSLLFSSECFLILCRWRKLIMWREDEDADVNRKKKHVLTHEVVNVGLFSVY